MMARNSKMYLLSLLAACLQMTVNCYGQVDVQDSIHPKVYYSWSHKKEVALNVTNLAKIFVPLNFTKVTDQEVTLKTKWYFRKVAVRIDFGASITPNQLSGQDFNNFYFSAGYEQRRVVYKDKWFYTTGWAVLIKSNADQDFTGLLKHFGMEYNIHPSVTLGTETGLTFGNFFNQVNLRLLPPTALFLQVRF